MEFFTLQSMFPILQIVLEFSECSAALRHLFSLFGPRLEPKDEICELIVSWYGFVNVLCLVQALVKNEHNTANAA